MGVLVGIMPMVGFIGGSLNNDALALAWGAVAFALLATANSRGHWLLALVLIVAGPLLVDKNMLYLWPLAMVWALLKIQRLRAYRLFILTGFIVLIALLLVPNPRWAAGWGPYPVLDRTRSTDNDLYLHDREVHLTQVIAGKSVLALRGQTVLLQADFWGEPGSVLNLQVTDGQNTQQQSCEASSQQQLCELPFVLDSHAFGIRVRAALGDSGHPQASDDIHLHLHLLDDSGRNLLFNGDGRFAASLGSPLFAWLEHQLPVLDGFFARALSPAAWDAPAQFRYLLFAGFTWASFWGYFGWLSRPLPWWSYALLAGFTLLAGWGLLRWGMAAIRRWRHQQTNRTDQVLVLSLLAFFFILAQVWSPMLGQAWQPQGRYLFSALLPISVILYLGWENALPVRWRPYLTPSLIFGLVGFNILAWMIVI